MVGVLMDGREQKVVSAEKNFAYGLPDSIVCIKGWHVPTCGLSPQPTLRGSLLRLRCLQAALQAAPSLAWLSTIRHLRWQVYPSLTALGG